MVRVLLIGGQGAKLVRPRARQQRATGASGKLMLKSVPPVGAAIGKGYARHIAAASVAGDSRRCGPRKRTRCESVAYVMTRRIGQATPPPSTALAWSSSIDDGRATARWRRADARTLPPGDRGRALSLRQRPQQPEYSAPRHRPRSSSSRIIAARNPDMQAPAGDEVHRGPERKRRGMLCQRRRGGSVRASEWQVLPDRRGQHDPDR